MTLLAVGEWFGRAAHFQEMIADIYKLITLLVKVSDWAVYIALAYLLVKIYEIYLLRKIDKKVK